MPSLYEITPLTAAQRTSYGVEHVRLLAFEALHGLWLRRKSEGRTQSELAATLGKDEGWLSKNLRGPGNWTMRIFGEMVEALDGEIEIIVRGAEDPTGDMSNQDAYSGYESYREFDYDDVRKGRSSTSVGATVKSV